MVELTSLFPAISGWQPIDTVPMDGTPVLVNEDGIVMMAAFFDDGDTTFYGKRLGPTWHTVFIRSELIPVTQGGKPAQLPRVLHGIGSSATHWMPIPATPCSHNEP